MGTVSPAEQLSHFFYMGLTWLRYERPDELARPGASVFTSYIRAGILPGSVRTVIEQSYDLMELIHSQSEVIVAKRTPSKGALRKLLSDSEKPNVILAISKDEFELERLFAPGGYDHAITDSGIELAQSIAGQYKCVVDKEKFLKGWRAHVVEMRGRHAKSTKNQQASTTADSTTERDTSQLLIPPAPYAGKEEW